MRSRMIMAGAALFWLGVAPAMAAEDDNIRINEIQVIGTHNSYHGGLLPNMARLVEQKAPSLFQALDYRHPNLAAQLSGGVRQLELDIFADSAGGRFAHPKSPEILAAAGLPPDADVDPDHLMAKPGFKVIHTQDVDYASNCQPFIACLRIVRAWSQAHPRHVPIFIIIETKQFQDDAPFGLNLTPPEPFTSATFDALDADIRSVFPAGALITPDQVRGAYPTLEAAALARHWPTLGESRGKVMFLMDQQNVGPTYLKGHTSLKGRVIFTNAEPGQPDAGFVELNDGPPEAIRDLVNRGYLVRTRTDADTVQARNNDTSRRDLALASGAQFLSTDYPSAEPSRWTGYAVGFPGGVPARCNPVLKPAGCRDDALEP